MSVPAPKADIEATDARFVIVHDNDLTKKSFVNPPIAIKETCAHFLVVTPKFHIRISSNVIGVALEMVRQHSIIYKTNSLN
jgi:hypothetical protein